MRPYIHARICIDARSAVTHECPNYCAPTQSKAHDILQSQSCYKGTMLKYLGTVTRIIKWLDTDNDTYYTDSVLFSGHVPCLPLFLFFPRAWILVHAMQNNRFSRAGYREIECNYLGIE